MPFVKLSKSERRRISLFFVCLALALGAWLFLSLSNRYVYQVRTAMRFIDFPQNKAFHSLQSDTVKLKIEGTGWQLLFSRLRISPQSVDINLRQLSKQNFISLTDQLAGINRQFASSQKVIDMEPDTLYFDFSPREIKKIPIRLIYDIQFVKQYGISGKIRLNPSYVTVTGPVKELALIDSWVTDTLKIKDAKSNISSRIALKKLSKANVNIYPSKTDVQIPINEFTEKSIDVPISVLNNSDFSNVKLIPDRVKVTFMVALSNYAKIDRTYFEAAVDLDNWRTKRYKQLPVKLTRFPDFWKLLRLEPQNVDFIIQK
jgi:YbbR domain-containing protein